MATSSWPDELRRLLRLRRLPAAYIERLMDELLDHQADLLQENSSMEANVLAHRLGTPEHLAERAAAEFCTRSFCGRHPVLTFIVAPIPLAALATVGTLLALVLTLGAAFEAGHGEAASPTAAALAEGLCWTLRFVPFFACVALFCRLASRSGRSWRWSLTACTLVALLAAAFCVSLVLPQNGPGSGSLTIGLALPPGAGQVVQGLATLAVGALLIARATAQASRWTGVAA